MALPGTYTNVKDIIERIHRTYGFSEVNEDEVAEWIWDIMSNIGVPNTFEDRTTVITITDRKGELPKDFFKLNSGGIREYETKTMMHPITDIFYQTDNTSDVEPAILPQDADPTTGEYFHTTVGPENNPEFYTYKIFGKGITVGFLTGEIEMAYQAFPICPEFGLPLIPDDSKYIAAIVDGVASLIAFRLFLLDKISEKKFSMIDQKALYSAGAARSRALMPDQSTMEVIRNIWMSPFPYYQHSSYGFRHLGKRDN